MLSPIAVKLMKIMPDSLMIKVANKTINGYMKKYANLSIEGFEKIKEIEENKIFICNHLSNADGLLLNYLLKKEFDPYFVAGVKLSDDPVTNIGTRVVKTILVKPNSADKEAITNMVKTVKNGNNLVIFPEGTRSRTGEMIEGKKGILLLARMTKAKIIPIGLSGTEKLLPINDSSDMGSEKWHNADVTVKFGEPVELRKREREEDKHAYEDECLETMMKSIARLLPEDYRGVYK